MNTLQALQQWYQSQCNGDWEHTYGVKIENLDNPGWLVTVELADTELVDQPFPDLLRMDHERDWIDCRVRDLKFVGMGGPFMLEEILRTFLAWAAEKQTK